MFLQYGSRNTIGTQSVCDANAYRGSIEELIAATTRGGSLMATTDQIIQKWAQGISHTADGTLICAVEWRVRDEEWQKAVDARLEELSLSLASLHAKVDTLATGGVEISAVAVAIVAEVAQRLGSNG
jgi:hypothetical protein